MVARRETASTSGHETLGFLPGHAKPEGRIGPGDRAARSQAGREDNADDSSHRSPPRGGGESRLYFRVQFDDLPMLRKIETPLLDLPRWYARSIGNNLEQGPQRG